MKKLLLLLSIITLLAGCKEEYCEEWHYKDSALDCIEMRSKFLGSWSGNLLIDGLPGTPNATVYLSKGSEDDPREIQWNPELYLTSSNGGVISYNENGVVINGNFNLENDKLNISYSITQNNETHQYLYFNLIR